MTRAELLAVAKPILFNTEMVRAVKDNRKTVTRRVIKPQPPAGAYVSNHYGDTWTWARRPDSPYNHLIKNLYYPGDILYVPERWKCSPDSQLWDDGEYRVVFPDGKVVWFYFENPKRAEKWQKYIDKPLNNWQSPYFMPKESARIFLRVTDKRVERLQDITEEQAIQEGIYQLPNDGGIDSGCWTYKTNPYENNPFGKVWSKDEGARNCFRWLWDSTIKPADRSLYGWDANPCVYVYDFEKMEVEK